jgi:hypothetical protein
MQPASEEVSIRALFFFCHFANETKTGVARTLGYLSTSENALFFTFTTRTAPGILLRISIVTGKLIRAFEEVVSSFSIRSDMTSCSVTFGCHTVSRPPSAESWKLTLTMEDGNRFEAFFKHLNSLMTFFYPIMMAQLNRSSHVIYIPAGLFCSVSFFLGKLTRLAIPSCHVFFYFIFFPFLPDPGGLL